MITETQMLISELLCMKINLTYVCLLWAIFLLILRLDILMGIIQMNILHGGAWLASIHFVVYINTLMIQQRSTYTILFKILDIVNDMNIQH